jgi:hypothetical protein
MDLGPVVAVMEFETQTVHIDDIKSITLEDLVLHHGRQNEANREICGSCGQMLNTGDS